MKYILLSIIITATALSAKDEISKFPDILFTSSYTATKGATKKQKEDRAYIGYCLHVLYLQTDYIDLKILGVDHEIKTVAKDSLSKNATDKEVEQVIKVSCKKALEKPDNFKDTLLHTLRAYKPVAK